MVGIILGVVALVLTGLLVRELWRPFAERARARGERRAKERELDARVEVAMGERGATPDRPIEVPSASVVEGQATSHPCVVCDHSVVAEDHAVHAHGDELLRVVSVHCRRCGHRRPVYVRIESDVFH